MDSLNTALMLLAVGMGTVFAILLIIIYFSKLLIVVVNRFAPEEEHKEGRHPVSTDKSPIPVNIEKVINKAVAGVAKGMKVTNIKKHN